MRRHRLLHYLLLAVLSALASFTLAACSYPSVEAATPDYSKKDKLVVALSYHNAPFSAEVEGKLVGYNVDIAAAIAQEMGLSVEFVDVTSGDGLDLLLKNPQIDILMSPGSQLLAPDGIEVVSRSYNANAPGLFTITSTGEAALATVQDIETASIAVQGDSVSDKLVSKLFPRTQRIQLRSINECFEALKSGRVKYVACDSLQGSYLATHYKNMVSAGLLESPEPMNILARVQPRGASGKTEEIRRAADSLKAGGAFDLIASKWFGKNLGSTLTGSLIELDEARKKAVFQLESNLSTATAQPNSETLDVNDAHKSMEAGANVSIPTKR